MADVAVLRQVREAFEKVGQRAPQLGADISGLHFHSGDGVDGTNRADIANRVRALVERIGIAYGVSASDAWAWWQEQLSQKLRVQGAESWAYFTEMTESATRMHQVPLQRVRLRQRISQSGEQSEGDQRPTSTHEASDLAMPFFPAEETPEGDYLVITDSEASLAHYQALLDASLAAGTQMCLVSLPRAVPSASMIVRPFCQASSNLLMMLENQSLRDVRNISEKVASDDGAASETAAPPRRKKTLAAYPNRATWLRREMHRRGNITPRGLAALRGPSNKTIQKVLEGKPVREQDVLGKLVMALNSADRSKPLLTIVDVPAD